MDNNFCNITQNNLKMYKIAYPYLLCNHLVIMHSCGLLTNEPKTEDQLIQKAAETTSISNMIYAKLTMLLFIRWKLM